MKLARVILVLLAACGGDDGGGAPDAPGGGGPDGPALDGATSADAPAPDGGVTPADGAIATDAPAPTTDAPAPTTDAPAPMTDAPPMTARTWTAAPAAHGLTGGAADASTGPVLVRGGDGVITAVWRGHSFTGPTPLWAGRFTPAGGWQTPVMLASGFDLRTPVVATGPSGHVVIAWQSTLTDEGRQLMRAVRFTPGSGWGPVTEIQGESASYVRDPAVGMDAAGNAIVAWTQGAANIANAWARRQRADGTWEAAVLLEHDDFTADPDDPTSIDWHHVYFPQIAVDGAGNAIAAWWQGGDGDTFGIRAARFTPAGGWAPHVNVPGGARGYNIAIAADPAGVVHMVWHVNPETGVKSLHASRFVNGAWTPAVTVDGDIEGAPAEVVLAVGADGTAFAAWGQDAPDSPYLVHAVRYVPATGWGASEVIGDAGRSYPYPTLGLDAAGAVHVAWRTQATADRIDVRARRWAPGSGWAPEAAVEQDDTVSASEPHLVVAPDGTAVAMWMMSDGIPEMSTRRRLWVGLYQ